MTTIFKNLIQDGTKFKNLISEVPNDSILGSLFQMRIRESDQLKTVLAMYDEEINQDRSKPTCQKLKKTTEKRHFDQKIWTRNVDVRNERIETGVLVKTRKGKNISVERKEGD